MDTDMLPPSSAGSVPPKDEDVPASLVTQAQIQDNVDIFGGDSDLSDFSDEEGNDSASSGPSRPKYREDDGSDESRAESSDDDEEAGVRAGDGEYKGDEDDSAAKGKGKKRGRVPAADDEDEEGAEDDDDGAGKSKKKRGKGKKTLVKEKKEPKKKRATGGEGEDERPRKKSKPKPKKREEDDAEPILDDVAARRKNLKDRIDEMIKKPKNKTGNRKKRGDDDDLGSMNDELVADLREAMLKAAAADMNANELGQPAYNKLKVLPRVVDMMQKQSLAESLIEGGILGAVTKWLEPLSDRSLPAIAIQRSLFQMLLTLSIESFSLKSSGLGKIVYFYTKCKTIDPAIVRIANQLVINWMRPLIGRSKEFVDRNVEANGASRFRDRPAVKMLGASAQDEAGIARRHARVPDAMTETFTVAPRGDFAARDRGGAGGSVSGAMGTLGKFKEMKKKMIAGQQASRRV